MVIDGDGTGEDYAYMHLAEPSPFKAGDRVYTGQRIGAVGETGNARGCHLHFELWGAPGWYQGGRPFDPLPACRPGTPGPSSLAGSRAERPCARLQPSPSWTSIRDVSGDYPARCA